MLFPWYWSLIEEVEIYGKALCVLSKVGAKFTINFYFNKTQWFGFLARWFMGKLWCVGSTTTPTLRYCQDLISKSLTTSLLEQFLLVFPPKGHREWLKLWHPRVFLKCSCLLCDRDCIFLWFVVWKLLETLSHKIDCKSYYGLKHYRHEETINYK